MLLDIVEFSKHSVNVDVLTTPLSNQANFFFNIVPDPTSSNYDWIKKNVNRTNWVRKVFGSIQGRKWISCRKRAAAALGLLAFADVACKLSLLLPPKKMDTETAAARRKEANSPAEKQQMCDT